MKSRFLRIISMILILASLVSMMTVFAYAETGSTDDSVVEDTDDGIITAEDFENFELLYRRDFSDGWDMLNGMTFQDLGSKWSIEYEVTKDYKYNYFFRYEHGTQSANSYLAWTLGGNNKVGSVIEFDIKADDICDVGTIMHFATPGSSYTIRNDIDLLHVKNNQLYLFEYGNTGAKDKMQATPICDLGNDWVHIAIVLDFTYTGEDNPDAEGLTDYVTYDEVVDENGQTQLVARPHQYDFGISVYYGSTEEYNKTGELTLGTKGIYYGESGQIGTNAFAKGLNFVRINTAPDDATRAGGQSVCFDNLLCYSGANVYGLATAEMGYGSLVNAAYPKTVEILGGTGGAATDSDYLNAALAMKVNVDYAKYGTSGRGPIMTDEEGNAWGAPVVIDGEVMVPLLPILEFINYPYYIHPDGIFVDISTGDTASYISIGKTSATVGTTGVELVSAPTTAPGYLAINIKDVATLLDGWYADYDEMGLIVIAEREDLMDREKNLTVMLELMKGFVFEYAEGDEIIEDVRENTNGFQHPYLLGDSETFAMLNDLYTKREESEYYDKDYLLALDRVVGNGDWKWNYRWYAYNGEWTPVLDEDGQPIYEPRVDKDGNPVYERERDADGYILYHETDTKEGNIEFKVGDPVLKKQTDADGEPIIGEDGNYVYIQIMDPVYEPVVYDDYDYTRLRTDDEFFRYWLDYYGYDEATMDKSSSAYRNAYSLYKNYSLKQSNLNIPGEIYETNATDKHLGDGYDEGGRSDAATHLTPIQNIAFAYAVTGDVDYLRCAYDMALKYGEWSHWGPGHFLNVADATSPFAYFYDWCYNGIVELSLDPQYMDANGESYYSTEKIADILWTNGVKEGWLSCQGIQTSHQSATVGTGGSFYHTRVNNWNAVCSAGMIVGALCLLDQDRDVLVTEIAESLNIADAAAWLISDNIYNLVKYGMDCYAPEGAYNEGPGYWNYGTNNFFELCMALDSAAGHNYGLMNCWGIDQTCYYALHTESSDYNTFNYHDGSMGTQTTDMFFYVASYFGDSLLSDVRRIHLQNGKTPTIFDLMYLPYGESEESELELDYIAKTLDLYAARSSWEPGAMYVAMMGGDNLVTHGQLDAGSFVYHNMGVVWFYDLGTENYNAYNFWVEPHRYRYYVMKPEGNNTITLVSDEKDVPYGQILDSTAPIVAYDSNEFGSYVQYDMTGTLGDVARSWNRGVLVTNDRKTTVIQDEIELSTSSTLYWFGHYRITSKGNTTGTSWRITDVKISKDGRTAFMYADVTSKNEEGKSYTQTKVLRVSIISDRSTWKFEIMTAYDFVHKKDDATGQTGEWATLEPGFSASQGMTPENDRSAYKKLAIKAENTTEFNVAVVLEEVSVKDAEEENDSDVAYRFQKMYTWEPVEHSDGSGGSGSDDTTVSMRPTPKMSELPGDVKQAGDMREKVGRNITNFYRLICDACYTVNYFTGIIENNSNYADDVEKYQELKEIHDDYRKSVNGIVSDSADAIYLLMGQK